jgi:hypothetical protein
VHVDASAFERPVRWLVRVAIVMHKPREEVNTDLTMPARAFQDWDPKAVEPGTYRPDIGSSTHIHHYHGCRRSGHQLDTRRADDPVLAQPDLANRYHDPNCA